MAKKKNGNHETNIFKRAIFQRFLFLCSAASSSTLIFYYLLPLLTELNWTKYIQFWFPFLFFSQNSIVFSPIGPLFCLQWRRDGEWRCKLIFSREKTQTIKWKQNNAINEENYEKAVIKCIKIETDLAALRSKKIMNGILVLRLREFFF